MGTAAELPAARTYALQGTETTERENTRNLKSKAANRRNKVLIPKEKSEEDRKRAKSADTDEASDYTELRGREKKSGNPWNNTRRHADSHQERHPDDDDIEASPASTEAAEGRESEPPWGRKLGGSPQTLGHRIPPTGQTGLRYH